MIPEWSPEALTGLRRLFDFIARTPRGKPAMRVGEVLTAVAALPERWQAYRVRRRVGSVELRRQITKHGTVIVFSHEVDAAHPAGVILVRWIAHGSELRQSPPLRTVRPAAEMPRARPPQ